MAARWTAEEHNTLVSLLVDGVSIQSLCNALPMKTEGAIVTRARQKSLGLDFRTSRRDGKLYSGVNRRKHIKNEDGTQEEATTTIVGELRVATTTQVPTTTSETINTESDVIVPQDSKRDALISIYDDISALIECKNYTSIVSSITVKLANAEFTLHGVAHEK